MSPVMAERFSALVVIAVGVAACVLARRLPAQTGFGLGPAFLPFWIGVVLAACGLWLCARPANSTEGSWPSPRGLARAGAGFVAILFYVLALEPLGYFLSTSGFLIGGMLLLELGRPFRALIFGFGSSFFLLIIFRIWLRVPLPGGLLGL